MKRLALLVVPAIALLVRGRRPRRAKDYARTAFGIVPVRAVRRGPGPARGDDQALMYDALTPLFDQVKPSDLPRTFKSERARHRAARAR